MAVSNDELPQAATSTPENAPAKQLSSAQPKKKPVFNPAANHGRIAASTYTGCPVVQIPHLDLQAGAACPLCEAAALRGKLRADAPSVIVKLIGSPLITGTRYEIERLRCSLCQEYYTAPLPPDIARRGKYDKSCRTALALARYYSGQPFYRTQQLQALQGIPLADATQWQLTEQLYAILLPIFLVLKRLSSNGSLIRYDDTGNRILEAYPTKTNAVHTTALISEMDGHAIYLFFTGLLYAGKNVGAVMKQRTHPGPVMSMSDASSQNSPHGLDETLLARWIVCFCLVHGRRKFYELQPFFTKECEFVIEVISQIYQHERQCKERHYTPEQRLLYHQAHSAPLMEALRVWLNNQLLHRANEPNSAFGQAVSYLLKHWQPLTRFLHIAGAPIDNSLCEQAIKIVIRHRRNSLFYKTYHGAQVGDCLMSIIHTAAKNQVNLFDYLNTLQQYAEAVALKPDEWLPWNYQITLAAQTAPQAA